MAQYTQEDVDKMRDSLKEKYNYDNMSDEQKKKFDDTFDAEIDKYREQGIVENKNDADEDGDDDSGDMENGMERERGRESGGKEETEESKDDEDPVKKKENEQMDAQITDNQDRINAERQKKEEEAEKKDRDYGDRSR